MLALYGHLFSSYTWKALIPLYANDTPFEFVNVYIECFTFDSIRTKVHT